MKTALVPGSFDPITLGHINIIKRAAALFDRVVVCVMTNREKTYLFSLEERKALAENALSGMPNVTVDSHSGMLWEYARDNDVCAIVKGIRCAEDTAYELMQAEFNAEKYPQAQTVLLPAERGLEDLSSTAVRALAKERKDLSGLVSENVEKELIKKYGGIQK